MIDPKRRDALDWLFQLTYTTGRLFLKNGLQNHAAATAFYFMLSATPLLLLLAYATQWLARLAETSVPATMLLAALYEQLHLARLSELGFIPNRAQLAAGGVSLITLALSARGLVKAVQKAFKIIFPDEHKRPFVLNWGLSLVILPLALLVLGLAIGAQAMLSFFAEIELLGPGHAVLFKGLNLLLAFATLWGLIFAAYWRLPVRRPKAGHAIVTALLAAACLFGLFGLFDHFFQVEKYRAVYGALGGVVFILIGAYAACVLFYLWAQALYALARVDVAALERLFLAGSESASNKLESYVFGRANRLLAKYGRTFAPGEVIIREGERSDTAYFLYAGRVGLYKSSQGKEIKLGTLGEGELFGEMAYLLGEARTATVIAETEVTLLALPPALLEELMRYSAPLARRIIGTLCQRLQRMNEATQARAQAGGEGVQSC